MKTQHQDFYQRLRTRTKTWADSKPGVAHKLTEFILLAPDFFHLLCKLMLDRAISLSMKAKIAGVIYYFILPIDLLPEAFLGPAAYIDDVAVAALVLNQLFNQVDSQLIERHWAGDRPLLETVKQIIAKADQWIGSGLWRRLVKKFG